MTESNLSNLLPILSAIIGLFAAIIGGFITHLLTARRDRINKRTEQRIGYLLEAFYGLSTAVHNSKFSENTSEFERAITTIQLFGSKQQIDMVYVITKEFAENGTVDLNELLLELRNSLRLELSMEKVNSGFSWIRIENLSIKPAGKLASRQEMKKR